MLVMKTKKDQGLQLGDGLYVKYDRKKRRYIIISKTISPVRRVDLPIDPLELKAFEISLRQDGLGAEV